MSLTPREIVAALDEYIVGQNHAKRMVAIALRNRTRRRQLTSEKAAEVMPKNILLIGPTGVGKTEIARRLAALAQAPFVKVEATKYTEVGYVGRDVESMVRDLVDTAIGMVRAERAEEVKRTAEERAEEELLDLLLPPPPRMANRGGRYSRTSVYPAAQHAEVEGPGFVMRDANGGGGAGDAETKVEARAEGSDPESRWERSREKMRAQLRDGILEERQVDLEVSVSPAVGVIGGPGMEEMGIDMSAMLEKMMPRQTHRRTMSVAEARTYLLDEATEELLDQEAMAREALARAAEDGIIFLDEIDKIAGRGSRSSGGGPDVSREGVQRDILPIVEGSSVKTKYGQIQTDHILFIAAGAFTQTKPSDLIPELQGRFPLRSELTALTSADFERILTEPRSSLCGQYRDLLATDGVELEFTADGTKAMAEAAFRLNEEMENIGARRLHTLMERVLEDVSFGAPDAVSGKVVVDAAYVREHLGGLLKDDDHRRFIL